jgi:hypothetical protein
VTHLPGDFRPRAPGSCSARGWRARPVVPPLQHAVAATVLPAAPWDPTTLARRGGDACEHAPRASASNRPRGTARRSRHAPPRACFQSLPWNGEEESPHGSGRRRIRPRRFICVHPEADLRAAVGGLPRWIRRRWRSPETRAQGGATHACNNATTTAIDDIAPRLLAPPTA